MTATGRAHDLGARHSVARVRLGHDAVERRRLVEARPARARLELRVGAEERAPAAGAAVDPRIVLVPVHARECALRALLPEDLVLLRRQALAPLGVGELDLLAHCGILASSASASASRTGSSSTRSRTSWKKPRTIRRSASARVRPRVMR